MAESVTRVAFADITADSRRGGDLRVLLSPKTAGSTAGFMGALRLAPGQAVSEHRHPYSEEFIYVVSGSLVLRAGGEEVQLGPDVAALTPKGVPHRLENHGSETALVVFCLGPLAPRPELGHVDTEPLPGAIPPPWPGRST
ncbi:MAG TPA: cupin domain-containing protein [Streptosporangiaceae bacterium]|jgi:putative monooxygenase|nr:cupin domain-containing protein [Streptosporangiaceae bacterium]